MGVYIKYEKWYWEIRYEKTFKFFGGSCNKYGSFILFTEPGIGKCYAVITTGLVYENYKWLATILKTSSDAPWLD